VGEYFIPNADATFHRWQSILMSNIVSRAAMLNIPPAEVVDDEKIKQELWKDEYSIITRVE
jgi:hypothetical protein